MSPTRRRIVLEWITVLLAAAAGGLTLVMPAWVEAVFGADPDAGSGTVEWLIVAVALTVAVAAAWSARRDQRRVVAARRDPLSAASD